MRKLSTLTPVTEIVAYNDRQSLRNALTAKLPSYLEGEDLPGADEESLVKDHRAGLSPRQQVERRLVSLLKSNPLPVSQLLGAARKRP